MKKLFLTHWEKVILIAATVIFLAGYLSMYSVSEDSQVSDAVKAWDDIAKNIEGKNAESVPVPDVPGRIEKNWKGVNSIQPVTGLGWELEKPVNVNVKVNSDNGSSNTPPASVKKHIAPKLEVSAQFGSVAVSWEPDPANEAAVDTYMLFKKTNENDSAAVGEFSAAQTSFEDKIILPNTRYFYRIISRTGDRTADYDEAETQWIAVDTGQDFQMDCVGTGNANNQDEANAVGYQVSIRIKKNKEGKEYTEYFNVKKGDKIGKTKSYIKDPLTGQPYVNPITEKQESLIIDFSTGYTLARVVVDDKGNETLIYTDEKGVEHTLVPVKERKAGNK